MSTMRTYFISENAFVLEIQHPITLQHQQRIWALSQHYLANADIRETIPGMNNLTVILHQPVEHPDHYLNELQQQWQLSDNIAITPRVIEIPVHYGGEEGPDLAFVAKHAELSPQEVIALHSSIDYTVYFLGFQPGFPYLGGLPERLATPRLSAPRLSVPKGSVGIAGSQTGVYPLTTPGGWQIIGRTPLDLFDINQVNDPVLLRPGDTVRFIPTKGESQ